MIVKKEEEEKKHCKKSLANAIDKIFERRKGSRYVWSEKMLVPSENNNHDHVVYVTNALPPELYGPAAIPSGRPTQSSHTSTDNELQISSCLEFLPPPGDQPRRPKRKILFAAGRCRHRSIRTYIVDDSGKKAVNLMEKTNFSASWSVFLLKT